MGILLVGVILIFAPSSGSGDWDFSSFYTAGLTARMGRGRDLYDLAKQATLQQKLFHRNVFIADLHPPFEALFLAPLTFLGFAHAYALWGIINVALWMLFAYLIRPHAPSANNPLRYILLCFMFFPAWAAMLQGQTSLLVLDSYALAFLCLKRGRDFWAGAFLGGGLFKFAIVLPFALIFLLRAKWRVIAGFVSAAALLAAAAIVGVGFAGVRAYAQLLLYAARHPAIPPFAPIRFWVMPTIRGFLSALLARHFPSVWINAAAALVASVFLLFTARRWRRADRSGNGTEQDLMFAAALAVSLVTAPYLYTHDLTVLLPALLLVVGSPQWTERKGWRVTLTVCLAILYFPLVYLLLAEWALPLVLVTFALTTLVVASKAAQGPRADKLEALSASGGGESETIRAGSHD